MGFNGINYSHFIGINGDLLVVNSDGYIPNDS